MSGAQGRFDGGQVRERIIRTRVNAALADLPPAVRKLRYDEEYKRQTELYNQERITDTICSGTDLYRPAAPSPWGGCRRAGRRTESPRL